jgi:hypothetical protein
VGTKICPRRTRPASCPSCVCSPRSPGVLRLSRLRVGRLRMFHNRQRELSEIESRRRSGKPTFIVPSLGCVSGSVFRASVLLAPSLHREATGALQHEPVAIRRTRQPVQQALVGVSREREVEVLASFPRQVQETLPHRGQEVPLGATSRDRFHVRPHHVPDTTHASIPHKLVRRAPAPL